MQEILLPWSEQVFSLRVNTFSFVCAKSCVHLKSVFLEYKRRKVAEMKNYTLFFFLCTIGCMWDEERMER